MTNKSKGIQRTGYMSDFDAFFHDFDKNRELPASRIAEVKKLAEIFKKRDNPTAEQSTFIWEKF